MIGCGYHGNDTSANLYMAVFVHPPRQTNFTQKLLLSLFITQHHVKYTADVRRQADCLSTNRLQIFSWPAENKNMTQE